jgi:PKD repeat protein
LTVTFTNESTGDYDTCAWDFGDGEGNDECEGPTHIYDAGTFTVTLTVTGPGGTDTLTQPDYITAYPPGEPPTADFDATPRSGTAPLTVTFTNESTGDYDTCAWDFGDSGGSDECEGPTHVYAAGTFTVTLTVTGPGGTDTQTRPSYITAYAPGEDYRTYLPILIRRP